MTETCHDCGAKEGEIHKYGCDMERCPFCGNQLISCGCCYTALGFDYNGKKPFSGLPEDIYKNGLTLEMKEKWIAILNKKGRIPYIILPNYCRRCLERFPEMFQVPDEEWQRLPKELHNEMLCRKCYDMIMKWMKDAGQK